MLRLPYDIIALIAEVGGVSVQAKFARLNKGFHDLFNPILYRQGAIIAYILRKYKDQDTIIRVLDRTVQYGADITEEIRYVC